MQKCTYLEIEKVFPFSARFPTPPLPRGNQEKCLSRSFQITKTSLPPSPLTLHITLMTKPCWISFARSLPSSESGSLSQSTFIYFFILYEEDSQTLRQDKPEYC